MRNLKQKNTIADLANNELLRAIGVDIQTPLGRPLFNDLNLVLATEQVAIVGRNGVGKSTLIEVLAQHQAPFQGRLECSNDRMLVYQNIGKNRQMLKAFCSEPESVFQSLSSSQDWKREWQAIGLHGVKPCFDSKALSDGKDLSDGEWRKLSLLLAKFNAPQLLFLDEPSEDLDERGIGWLSHWLANYAEGLVVISHERRILKLFQNFIFVTETGCRYFQGSFAEMECQLEKEDRLKQKSYAHELNGLIREEQHQLTIAQRRKQKKNLGRISELGRMTPRSRLNKKRSYAQESQGRVKKVSQNKIAAARDRLKLQRRMMRIHLSMHLFMPVLDPFPPENVVVVEDLTLALSGRELVRGLNLHIKRERIAVVGENGSGKTSLLKTILKQHMPSKGAVLSDLSKIGSIAQGAVDWMRSESLMDILCETHEMTTALEMIQSHRFPWGLAQRSLLSLSPGERIRAAFIAVLSRQPSVEVLVLDEPSYSIDFIGYKVLCEGLKAWPGGLLVASHDSEFIEEIGIQQTIRLESKSL